MKLRTDLPLGWRIGAGLKALVIPVLLLIVPLDRLTRWLGRTPDKPREAPPDAAVSDWIDNLLHRLPWPWRHTCLRRSAVLYHLLRRAGRAVQLCVGVKRNDVGALAAHAWLTLDGEPYLESRSNGAELHEDFTIIARFPEPIQGAA